MLEDSTKDQLLFPPVDSSTQKSINKPNTSQEIMKLMQKSTHTPSAGITLSSESESSLSNIEENASLAEMHDTIRKTPEKVRSGSYKATLIDSIQ